MPSSPPLAGRTVLVTGANAGIGYETTLGLARLGASLVMAVRDPAKGEAARERIVRETGHADIHVERVDLARLADVRRFARDFRARHEKLHVLVNNAGFHTAERVLTPDGFESTFAVNHLAHFLLTRELLPLLKASAPARVVTVGSEAHRFGRMDFDDLMGERFWSGILAYNQAKLANLMFAFELARRLEGTGVTSNAVHPGSVRTGWGRGESSGVFRFAVKLATPFLTTPEKGARTSIHLASAPEVEGVTGKYFVRSKPAKPSRGARDEAAQRRLWEVSEGLVGAG